MYDKTSTLTIEGNAVMVDDEEGTTTTTSPSKISHLMKRTTLHKTLMAGPGVISKGNCWKIKIMNRENL